jgi:hypothetical protein
MPPSSNQPVIKLIIGAVILFTGLGLLWTRQAPTDKPPTAIPKTSPAPAVTTETKASKFKAPAPAPGEALSPVILVGVDGFEWSVVLSLLAQEKLPNLRALIEDGVSGEIQTISPTGSPIIWTTIATGLNRKTHGSWAFESRRAVGSTPASIARPRRFGIS